MTSILRTLLASAVVLLTAGAAPAQEKIQLLVPIPEKLERATEQGEDGKLVWAKYEPERCVNCKGQKTTGCLHCERFDPGACEECPECENTKKATCRICAGTGVMPDILEKAPCPTCSGAAVTRCFVCGGRGQFPVEGGGDKPQKCNCCDGKGAYECETCDGERFVDTPKLKPSVAEADLDDLEKALAALEKVSEDLAAFESSGDGRKDIKAFAKLVKPGQRYFPALRGVAKHFEVSSKSQAKGAVWKGYEARVAENSGTLKHALAYYLKHQKRLLELCIARARHNEGVDK